MSAASEVISNSRLSRPISPVTTFAVATPANLHAIPSVFAQLPSPSNQENDVELQNGATPSVPVVIATPMRGAEADQPNSSTTVRVFLVEAVKKWSFSEKLLVLVFFILLFAGIAVAIAEVVYIATPKHDEISSSSTYIDYPGLLLAKTTPCLTSSTSYFQNSTNKHNISHLCRWKQLGSDLVGPSPGDFFGATLRLGGSAEGSKFSVTAPLFDNARGLTQVYEIVQSNKNDSNAQTDHSIQQLGKNITGKYENDTLKGIITDDGYHLIMASVDAANDGQPHIGRFASFQYSPDSEHWELYGNEMSGESSLDEFGNAAVNRNGGIAAISDIQYDVQTSVGLIVNAGVVDVFRFDIETNLWERLGQRIKGSSTDQFWGRKIALSGDGYIIAIGSRSFHDNKGKVKVYRYDANVHTWVDFGQVITGTVIGENVGREIELSADGKVLAVACEFHWSSTYTGKNKNGIVRVFEYNEASHLWIPLGNDIVSDLSTQSDFGYQLRTSDDGMRLAISQAKYSPSDDLNSAGRVRVFDYSSEKQDWISAGDVVGNRSCDFVGAGFDLSPDGSRLIVGFPNAGGWGDKGPACAKDIEGQPQLGIVRVYELQLL
ncbi:hypothetical protein ACHAW6_004398 [Cyclotella cf. meneghiniana]